VFSRAFSSEVQPVELARKLAKEMDAHKTASVQRVYVPNEYTVFLSRQDRSKLEGYERSLEQELSGYLLEHARRRGYDLLTRPAVEFQTDERLRLGEFGIQPRMVKAPVREGEAPRQGEEGHTMVYSAVRERDRQRPKEPEQDVRALVSTRAVVSLDDRRYVFDGPRATIGRSKSRRAAPFRLGGLADRRPRLDQRDQGERPPRHLDPPRSRRPGDGRHDHLPFRRRAVGARSVLASGLDRKVLSEWPTTPFQPR
jgi:hypothetical protein